MKPKIDRYLNETFIFVVDYFALVLNCRYFRHVL